jgi:CBS domain containing-hemolysin-like protein
MPLIVRRVSILFLVALFGPVFTGSVAYCASSHLVSIRQLRHAAESSASQRQAQIAQVEKFFSSQLARSAFKKAHLNPVEIQRAIPTLSHGELARLAAQTQKVHNDFAAGSLTNQQITYILIALGAALLVTIIFVS